MEAVRVLLHDDGRVGGSGQDARMDADAGCAGLEQRAVRGRGHMLDQDHGFAARACAVDGVDDGVERGLGVP